VRRTLIAIAVLLFASVAFGAEAAPPEMPAEAAIPWGWWALGFLGGLVALAFALVFFKSMMKASEGDETMRTIAGHVRDGANAYLRRQYRVVAIVFVILFLILGFLAFGLRVQALWVPFAFLTGGFLSGLCGLLGMRTATYASARTANAAKDSLNSALQVAFRSGAVMGLIVVGFNLLNITVWFLFLFKGLPWLHGVFPSVELFEPLSLVEITVTLLCSGVGASTQALFARVGGGIFTKAADVGADLVGKVEAGIPEDDPRNPATIADNVGDNVGDVAGMGADLFESYCGSILAAGVLGVAAAASLGLDTSGQIAFVFCPMAVAGLGALLSIVGIFMVRSGEEASQAVLLKALGRGVNIASIGIAILSYIVVRMLLPNHIGVWGSIVTGLLAGWLIGKWTEYSTSAEYKPTRGIADQSKTGPGTVIIAGIAEGMLSTWAPVTIIVVAILLSYGFAGGFVNPPLGLYGIGIAAVGMLSTLGITLATDAYGPIADNAGGNAEMSGQPPYVRERTDALDALGNTTAATGKGFAIGSAALTALALLAAYMEEVRTGMHFMARDAARTAIERQAEPDPDATHAGYAGDHVYYVKDAGATTHRHRPHRQAGRPRRQAHRSPRHHPPRLHGILQRHPRQPPRHRRHDDRRHARLRLLRPHHESRRPRRRSHGRRSPPPVPRNQRPPRRHRQSRLRKLRHDLHPRRPARDDRPIPPRPRGARRRRPRTRRRRRHRHARQRLGHRLRPRHHDGQRRRRLGQRQKVHRSRRTRRQGE